MLLPGFFSIAEKFGYRRSWIGTIILLQAGVVLFEALGIASIIPALEYMRSTDGSLDALAATSRGWRMLLDATTALGLPIGFGVVLGFAFAAIVIRQVFTYLRLVYAAFVENQFIKTLRMRGFSAYINAREDVRADEKRGEIVNDLTTELQKATACMSSAVSAIGYMMILVGYLIIVFALSPSLSLAAIAITGVVGVSLMYLTRQIRELGAGVTRSNQDVTSFLIERLGSGRLIRLCGMESAETSIFKDRLEIQQQRIFGLQKILAMFHVLLEPLALMFGFVLLYYAVESRVVGFESLILFFFILLRLVPVAKELMASRQSYVSLLASVDTVMRRFDILEGGREIDEGDRLFDRLKKGIRYSNVCFSYGNENAPAALKDVDLTIPAGQMVAIVGPSGAGKSTLVDLLPRIRTPQSGKILVDGVACEEFSLKSLRQAISYAPQQPQMFDVCVEEHIRYGKPDASKREVENAARLAQASGFIAALPEGYATCIGENGDRLSGGQRQRLDLARALVSGAPILILDEPTSNLDRESEKLFHTAISRIRVETDTTIIMIGHNLEAIRQADKIVVLVAGRIETAGTHEELMVSDNWFAAAMRNGSPNSNEQKSSDAISVAYNERRS